MESSDCSEAINALITEFHLALKSLNESDEMEMDSSSPEHLNAASVTRDEERASDWLCSNESKSSTDSFLF
ncbi:MAG: hypothetical protein CMA88_03435 [Euryarchaeota archaeon]|nr:hypothetical protein [Euryarchaeota archaeon]